VNTIATIAGYEQRLDAARRAFAGGEALRVATSPATSPDLLERFLLHFCAQGVGMTAPVEGWIRRAGERCTEMGLHRLGRALEIHARHEAGHDALFAADTRALAARRIAAGRPAIDAEALLALPAGPGVESYRALHEEVIASATPYGQLAIEYEIEALSVRHGQALLANCAEVLGPDVLSCLSFTTEHVELDAGHTRFNREQLNTLLAERPEMLEPLVTAGSHALAAYQEYLEDCLAWAQASDRADPDR
jgi:hypothetical protein